MPRAAVCAKVERRRLHSAAATMKSASGGIAALCLNYEVFKDMESFKKI